ncbi:thiolase C-terminal domain-containing protein, partial [Thermobrachium celere]|uniref:thiolase C-terminal domain-containing protein n=1 Tax=Thermobrachium celere TaxID=53422 RepID=UPI003BF9CD18
MVVMTGYIVYALAWRCIKVWEPLYKVVEIRSLAHTSDYLSIVEGKRPNYKLEAAEVAIQRALKDANMTINDINVAEVHDCFTITELLIYEAMGLAKEGRGFDAILN